MSHPLSSLLWRVRILISWDDRDIPLVLCAYLIWKYVKKTKIVSLHAMALDEAFAQADNTPDEPEVKKPGWVRGISWIWD